MSDLTPAEVNRRLAEALGWTFLRWSSLGWRGCPPGMAEPEAKFCPKFCSDLNACASARKALTEEERWRFVVALLRSIRHRDGRHWVADDFSLIDAPAEPQARALLAVLEGRAAR